MKKGALGPFAVGAAAWCREFVQALAGVAQLVDQARAATYEVINEFGGMPGIFDYEVSEEVGVLLAQKLLVDEANLSFPPMLVQSIIADRIMAFVTPAFHHNASAMAAFKCSLALSLPLAASTC